MSSTLISPTSAASVSELGAAEPGAILPVTVPVAPSITTEESSPNTEPLMSMVAVPCNTAAGIVLLTPSTNIVLSSPTTVPFKFPVIRFAVNESVAMLPVNQAFSNLLPSAPTSTEIVFGANAPTNTLPESTLPTILPSTPSTNNVLSSATTEPFTSPVCKPALGPTKFPVTVPCTGP